MLLFAPNCQNSQSQTQDPHWKACRVSVGEIWQISNMQGLVQTVQIQKAGKAYFEENFKNLKNLNQHKSKQNSKQSSKQLSSELEMTDEDEGFMLQSRECDKKYHQNQKQKQNSKNNHIFSQNSQSQQTQQKNQNNQKNMEFSGGNSTEQDAYFHWQVLAEKQHKKQDFWPEESILFQALIDKQYLEKMFEILPFSRFSKIIFFKANHSQIGNLSENIQTRLNNILLRSCQQAELPFLPAWEILSWKEILPALEKHRPTVAVAPQTGKTKEKTEENIQKSIQKKPEKNTESKKDILSNNFVNNSMNNWMNNSVLVGPEGGWSLAEMTYFAQFPQKTCTNLVFPAWLAPLMI